VHIDLQTSLPAREHHNTMETVTTTVRPCPTTLGQTTKLSQIDQIAPRDYVASYFFFRLPAGTDNTEVFRILEEGFHTTVQQIPDLMCCICECGGGRNELELRLHGDSGATITMKDFTSTAYDGQWTPGNFDQLERDHFPLQSLPQAHILAQTEFPDQVCLPTLAMQANFIEGGLVLTGCLHVCIRLCAFLSESHPLTLIVSTLSATARATLSSSQFSRNTSPPPPPDKSPTHSQTQPSVSSTARASSTQN
jgi:hypothetical protein